VPTGFTASTLSVHFNDLAMARQAFEKHPGDIAAILIEPVAGNMGVVPPADGYLAGLRDLCTEQGALLIFDEVMTGFRVAWGGAQALYGVQPDLTCLGKVIGGGLPVGAYAGPRKLMELISPIGSVYQAGTLSGNPLAMASGIATLEIMQEEGAYQALETRSGALEQGLADAATRAGVAVTINRVGSMLTPFFTAGPITNFTQATASDTQAYARFFHAMLDAGVYLPPSQYEAWFVGLQQDDDAIEKTIKASRGAFKSVAKG
jgi:glutamate-1-semialdehyde 2,1-aminomutase